MKTELEALKISFQAEKAKLGKQLQQATADLLRSKEALLRARTEGENLSAHSKALAEALEDVRTKAQEQRTALEQQLLDAEVSACTQESCSEI